MTATQMSTIFPGIAERQEQERQDAERRAQYINELAAYVETMPEVERYAFKMDNSADFYVPQGWSFKMLSSDTAVVYAPYGQMVYVTMIEVAPKNGCHMQAHVMTEFDIKTMRYLGNDI